MTTKEAANALDAAEATAIAGMLLDDRPGSVPSSAFDHPGRRALVAHWERVGRIALTVDDLTAAAKEGGVDMAVVQEAVDDTEAMTHRAAMPVVLREVRAELLQRKEVRAATESLRRVTADHERGNLPEEAVAAAWQRLANAKRLSGRMMQDADAGDFGPILDGVVAGLAETHARGWLGLSLTSFPRLNQRLCGLRGLMLLGAAPGVGKTQLTLQLGVDAVVSDPGVGLVYLSLEMSKHELATRMLCVASCTEGRGLSYRRLRMGRESPDEYAYPPGQDGLRLSAADRKLLDESRERLQALKGRLRLFGSEDVGALAAGDGDPSRWYEPLAGMVKDAKRRMGVARALVVVDNLQAIAVEPPYGRPWASDMDRDRTVIEGLTRLQHDTDDAVLVVSEVAKGKFDGTSKMAAILGTGRHSYRADAVMLLKRRSDDDPSGNTSDTLIDLIVDKGRDGMNRGTVELEWVAGYGVLQEVDK